MHGCNGIGWLSRDIVRPYRRMFVAHGLDLHSLFEGMGGDGGIRFRERISNRGDIDRVLRTHMGVAAREMAMMQGINGCWAVAQPMLRVHWREQNPGAFAKAMQNALLITLRGSGLFTETEIFAFAQSVSRKIYSYTPIPGVGVDFEAAWFENEIPMREILTSAFRGLLELHRDRMADLLNLWLRGDQRIEMGAKVVQLGVENHQRDWNGHFESMSKELRGLLPTGIARIEHVGATAVPGLMATPVIDIMVGLPNQEMVNDLVLTLSMAGWQAHISDASRRLGHELYRNLGPESPNGRLLLVKEAGREWQERLLFRDGLRNNSHLAGAYARLKCQLAELHIGDRQSYDQGKAAFIRNTLSQLQLEMRAHAQSLQS